MKQQTNYRQPKPSGGGGGGGFKAFDLAKSLPYIMLLLNPKIV